MPMVFERVEVDFQGLAEHLDPRKRPVGTLAVSQNVQYAKTGAINKRRGYLRVTQTADVLGDGIDPEQCEWQRVATYRGELVVIGHTVMYGLVNRTTAVSGGQLALRGPVARCNITTNMVSAASLTATRDS